MGKTVLVKSPKASSSITNPNDSLSLSAVLGAKLRAITGDGAHLAVGGGSGEESCWLR